MERGRKGTAWLKQLLDLEAIVWCAHGGKREMSLYRETSTQPCICIHMHVCMYIQGWDVWKKGFKNIIVCFLRLLRFDDLFPSFSAKEKSKRKKVQTSQNFTSTSSRSFPSISIPIDALFCILRIFFVHHFLWSDCHVNDIGTFRAESAIYFIFSSEREIC